MGAYFFGVCYWIYLKYALQIPLVGNYNPDTLVNFQEYLVTWYMLGLALWSVEIGIWYLTIKEIVQAEKFIYNYMLVFIGLGMAVYPVIDPIINRLWIQINVIIPYLIVIILYFSFRYRVHRMRLKQFNPFPVEMNCLTHLGFKNLVVGVALFVYLPISGIMELWPWIPMSIFIIACANLGLIIKISRAERPEPRWMDSKDFKDRGQNS